ncbi:Agglutinin receptor precursor [Enhygromyxa salina]|uniref:Agglutinin receptor n=1 Tax=Enhygromyxa salina TaxID=215803 RepID=A0A2S9YEI8_9BACT|nr:hypothetical protein [Enhygromyxa salina]PRQ03530.1 Agglutinin receptor precursor [Enhygromyxa salina]
MVSPALVLAAALLLGPPSGDQRPPVQTPKVSPIQPQPGDPAIAPAHVETEAAAEPTPMPADPTTPEPAIADEPEPAPEPEPQPAPEPGPTELPTWQSEPVVPADDGSPELLDEWGSPTLAPVKPEPRRGVGLYAAAGGLFGVLITRQWVTALSCDDPHCGHRGNADRVFGLALMGFAGGGGWLEGRRTAYLRHEADEPVKQPKGRRAAGWTLFAVGIGGLIADTALYNLCYERAVGPYTQVNGFRYTCSPITSVVVIDLSTALGAVGLGLGLSAESQLRNRKKYELSVAPWGGRGQAGLSLSGRF